MRDQRKKVDEIQEHIAYMVSQNLVKLESNQLYIQLSEAQANLSVTKARLDKLVNGESIDEIKVTEISVTNAQISLDTANKNLNDATLSAPQNFKDLTTFKNAYSYEQRNQRQKDTLDNWYTGYQK